MISCAEFSKFNGSTAEEQFSIFSIVCSASTSVIRSILFTRVKEAGGEINLSSWSKLMIFCLDIDNKNQCSYYFWCLFMRTNHTKWKKKFTVESLFQAYLMLASAVLTLQKKKVSKKSQQFLLCAQTCKRISISAVGHPSCRSRIAACTIISAWVSISPKASASNITSFIILLRSATYFSKIRKYVISKI